MSTDKTVITDRRFKILDRKLKVSALTHAFVPEACEAVGREDPKRTQTDLFAFGHELTPLSSLGAKVNLNELQHAKRSVSPMSR